jgi:LacI family transcriptional regulator
MKAVTEVRYQPNLHARNLAGGKSRTIGVIVSNMENPFFFDIYKAVEEDAHARGYEVLVADTDYNFDQLLSSVRWMIGRRVEGLAAIVSEMAPAIVNELGESRLPAVFCDGGSLRQNSTNIRVNYCRGIEKVVDYLRSLGHRKFGFVGHHSSLSPAKERMNAALDALARIPEVEVRTAADRDTLEGGRAATRNLLAAGFLPTAIICMNDLMAIGALRELRERGLRVPQDVSVTGFDNVKLSEFSCPALTTVHIPRDRIGRMICERLIPAEGSSSGPSRELVIDPEFILRESTGPVART